MSDPLIQQLAELPAAKADAARAERIRIRCRAELERRASRESTASPPIQREWIVQAWPPLIAGLGIAYLTEVIVLALRVYGRP